MKTYHVEVKSDNPYQNDDQAGEQAVYAAKSALDAAGGSASLSKGFGATPTLIVVELPDNQKVETFFSGRSTLIGGVHEQDKQTEISNG